MNKNIIHVGLIGLGRIGKTHAMGYQTLQAATKQGSPIRIAAVLRSHPDQDEDFLSQIGSPFVTDSADEFFGRELDLIDICTPNMTHESYSRRACEAGMPIYCEKPLGRDLEEARRMLACAEQAGVATHTAFVYRYMPALQQLQQAISDGEIGAPLHFRVHLYHSGYLDPLRPSSWRLRHADSGGGALADLGIHLIDLLHMAMGDCEWVQCETKTFINARPAAACSRDLVPVDVDDWAVCTIGMKNGAAGTLEVSRMAAGMQDLFSFEVCGERGSLKADFSRLGHAFLFKQFQSEWEPLAPLHDSPETRNSRRYLDNSLRREDFFFAAHMACIEDFLYRLQNNESSPLDFAAACKAQQVLEAAYRSSAEAGSRIAVSSL